MRIASLAGCTAVGFGLAASMALGGAAPARGVTMRVVSANVNQAGETARVCIELNSGRTEVAGTQNDLVWDGDCATLSDGDCFPSGEHGKQVSTTIPGGPNSTLLRAIVISLSDTDPIDDGELYCCNFRSELTQAGSSCPIDIANAKGSTPDAQPVPIRGVSGSITLSSSGSNGGGGSGCQLSPGAGGSASWPFGLGGLLLWRRRHQ